MSTQAHGARRIEEDPVFRAPRLNWQLSRLLIFGIVHLENSLNVLLRRVAPTDRTWKFPVGGGDSPSPLCFRVETSLCSGDEKFASLLEPLLGIPDSQYEVWLLDGSNEVFVGRGAHASQRLLSSNSSLTRSRVTALIQQFLEKRGLTSASSACDVRFCSVGALDGLELAVVLRYVGRMLVELLRKAGLWLNRPASSTNFEIHIGRRTSSGIDASSFNRVRPKPGTYVADPFLIEANGATYCFVEEFDFDQARGSIVTYELRNSKFVRRHQVLSEDFHISFPRILSINDQWFMTVESLEAGQIRLYRATQFPDTWQLDCLLMSDIKAVDPILFESKSRWYLLATTDVNDDKEFTSKLRLFVSQSDFRGPYTEHPHSPVKDSPLSGRNGGLIEGSDSLIRCAQVQDFGVYGKSLRLYQVTEVTPTTYREDLIGTIRVQGGGGVHHLSVLGELVAIDRFGQGELRTT